MPKLADLIGERCEIVLNEDDGYGGYFSFEAVIHAVDGGMVYFDNAWHSLSIIRKIGRIT